jgi:tetratricopeptide (TPR) repeat protein
MLAAEPDDPFVLYGLAQEYAKAGEHARAVEYFDRCLAADPGYHYAYYHKGRSQEALGRRDDAAVTVRAGFEAARRGGDEKAAGELAAYLDELT